MKENILKPLVERVISLLNKTKSIRKKIFLGVFIFVLLNVLINIIIVRVSINNIYLSLEKKELKKQYEIVKKNMSNDDLQQIMFNANNEGIKIKLYDITFSPIYTIFNDKINDKYNNLNMMLLENLGNQKSKIITLKNYEKSGYDLHLVGKTKDGYVILSSSIEQLKKDARTTTIIILNTSLITLVIFLVISYFISKLVSNRIKEVKDVTDDIKDLKFTKKVKVKTNDELGDLLNNINTMSDKLELSINDLESANKKLKKELEEKEKQEQARKKLIANISHEFKTPLTVISGYSQLMLSESKNEEEKKNLELMINESSRLSDLVHEFLELSRLESGNITLNKEKVNIKDLINKELENLSVSIKKNNINVKTKFIDNQEIIVDKKQFNKVIVNILTNAIKFAKNKKIIEIKTYTKDKYFYYEVFNTGDNIKEEELETIFNSYYKNKSERNKEGTGLGLTIVKAIVDLHNGICEVKNTKDGVKFIIKIEII
ncbi:MAG: HAMP domain-containing histidine kinase [Bacilli bacterium]|nr:HAMP domain-containing histidine kinase [Bacilli bacterium]